MSTIAPKPKTPPPSHPDAKLKAALNRAIDELAAAVEETERATQKILGVSELLIDHVDGPNWHRVMAIMEACSFQDLTGQRIDKVSRLLKYLRDSKQMTSGVRPAAAPPPPPPKPKVEEKAPEGLSQEEVDKLLNGG